MHLHVPHHCTDNLYRGTNNLSSDMCSYVIFVPVFPVSFLLLGQFSKIFVQNWSSDWARSTNFLCFSLYFFKISWAKLTSFWANRGYAWLGTHLRTHDFTTSLGFLLYRAIWRKTHYHFSLFDNRISNFAQVCVLIFLSLGCTQPFSSSVDYA